jgi:rRNA-processing protein FCF1
MSNCFLYYIIRLGLAEKFFEASAEKLVLTRSEFQSLDRLVRKGYFSAAEIEKLRSERLITAAPTVKLAVEEQEDIDPSVRQTVMIHRELGAVFVITEDDTLRRRLQEAGLNVIATPEIIYHMAKKGAITPEEAREALEGLKLFGWHNREVLDRIKEAIQTRET